MNVSLTSFCRRCSIDRCDLVEKKGGKKERRINGVIREFLVALTRFCRDVIDRLLCVIREQGRIVVA